MSQSERPLHMVDLFSQHQSIQPELDEALAEVFQTTRFIKGPIVSSFEKELGEYLGGPHVVGVGSGTDALQIAFMALGLQPGDEVITPAFTFIATAEAAALLGIRPVFVDVQADSFNMAPDQVEALITDRTRAIVPVHLFGQPCDLDPILETARRHGLFVVEDNAQSIGSMYQGRPAGILGDIGTLSFFPSKNLGGVGDGGAVVTNDPALAERARMIANHGSRRKYHNEIVGINSRLDTLQAAVLRVKLRHLDRFNEARQNAASVYDELLSGQTAYVTPTRRASRTHVFHQYTVRCATRNRNFRDGLFGFLKDRSIPHAVYYPVPLNRLPVFSDTLNAGRELPVTDMLCDTVLSIPMHTELSRGQQSRVVDALLEYAHQKPELQHDPV
jgi:dTDP-4-amino-4,6-dideoxygalactose transaminase